MNITDYYLHSIGPINEKETLLKLENIVKNSLLSKSKQGESVQSGIGSFLNGNDYISLLDLEVVNAYNESTGSTTKGFYNDNSVTLLIDRERVDNDTVHRNYCEYKDGKYPLTLGEIQVKDCIPSEYIVGIAIPKYYPDLDLLNSIIDNNGFEVAVCNYDGEVIRNTIINKQSANVR